MTSIERHKVLYEPGIDGMGMQLKGLVALDGISDSTSFDSVRWCE